MTPTGRHRVFTALCARLTLAAFVSTLPGSAAWAQAVSRVTPAAPSAAGVSGAAGAVLQTPEFSIGAPSALPALHALSAPTAVTLSPVAAFSAVPPSAPAKGAKTTVRAAVPVTVHAAVPAEAAPAVSARDSLTTAARDMKGADSDHGGIRHFDGAGSHGAGGAGAADGGDSQGPPKSNKPAPLPAPSQAPVLALTRVFFPNTPMVTLSVNTRDAAAVIKAAVSGGYMIAATAGRGTDQGHNVMGTLMRVSMPSGEGGRLTVRLEPIRPVKITGYAKADVPTAQVSYPKSVASNPAHLRELSTMAIRLMAQFASGDPEIDHDVIDMVFETSDEQRLTNILAQELPFSDEIRQRLLSAPSTESRMELVVFELMGHFHKNAPKAPNEAKGGSKVDIETPEGLKAKMEAIGMPEAIRLVTQKEFDKLSQMNPKDSEAQKLRAYIEWLTDVPWGQRTQDNFDIDRAREILERDHAGLEMVKERVLEFLALRKKTGTKKGAILVFTGPPGVGKTSIAGAIAEALGRKFVRLSLGGVHDETVLRGHGRTYVGSMPGEIMRRMKAAGVVNPVMLLDEVDKIGRNGNQGDPTAALLEILDPEQHNTFRDRYLDVPYDLSEVLFVVTSNDLANIPAPLRDRMEIIEFDGYTTLEKLAIAQKHIIPQKLAVNGLTSEETTLTKGAIRRIIEGYTMEAGVRTLREKIESVLRKISAWTEMKKEQVPGVVDEKDIEKYLGVRRFSPDEMALNGVGLATGLSVNSLGGSTLNVEAAYAVGTGQLTLRYQFGDDIKDSAENAYMYVKTHAVQLGLKGFDFSKIDLHLSFTCDSKIDGPSAGGLMATAIVSALTGRPVAPGLAMTGKITMHGNILPIGGLKQKVMAAHRMGYKMVIFPAANLKDVESIPQEVREGIELKAVSTYDEIYPVAIVPAPNAG